MSNLTQRHTGGEYRKLERGDSSSNGFMRMGDIEVLCDTALAVSIRTFSHAFQYETERL